MESIRLLYTLCFCITGDSVLMLHRNSSPNRNLWNGIGGKIEEGEGVRESLYREVLEESGVDLPGKNVTYTGIVCWNSSNAEWKGMYSFIVDLPHSYYFPEERITREGILQWKKIDWVVDNENPAVVDNIPQFLPHMLLEKTPHLYRCVYNDLSLQYVKVEPLPLIYQQVTNLQTGKH